MKFVFLLIFFCAGCSVYKECPYTPDGFNYTLSRDRKTGEQIDYFGLSWNLKP